MPSVGKALAKTGSEADGSQSSWPLPPGLPPLEPLLPEPPAPDDPPPGLPPPDPLCSGRPPGEPDPLPAGLAEGTATVTTLGAAVTAGAPLPLPLEPPELALPELVAEPPAAA